MPEYIVGIDLGTTNSALAFVSSSAETEDGQPVSLFQTPQLVSPGEIANLDLLPSSLYIPGANEFVEGTLALPWNPQPQYIVGALARARGVENSSRLVSSAKSWLSNQTADPTQPLLPLTAPEGIAKVSPLDASREYLAHLRSAWDYLNPDAALANQSVLITVPASFDAAARDLTQRAARMAGYPEVTVIEEPQAAFYAWIDRNPNWRERVKPGDLVLVVDIGGGTTDLTLISVIERDGELQLERIAVGEHLLLGGDNMDLALARFANDRFAVRGTKLDAIQFHALWQQCRAAKEVLLSGDDAPEEHPLTILGRGTGLVGGTLREKLHRDEVRNLLLEGFFPVVGPEAAPQRQRRTGLMEVGLNYASDAAVTRHIAQFLRQAASNAGVSGFARPTHLLLNGGVLQAGAIEHRIFEVINQWLIAAGAPPITSLQDDSKHADLMHAVARGATYYGLARTGKGVRIRGGVPRTYYVGIETSLPAVPGLPAPLKVLAVAPFGLEEGSKVELPQRKFAVVVGEPADFRFFSSLTRKNDAAGTLLDEVTDDLEELAPIEVLLPVQNGESRDQIVPVTLESNVTETGMLELWCVAADGRRWKLEFNVRERPAA
ncbi:MAG TPA: Hsp70 family protein [Bryobacteraceae bacterium]|jgi:molecular chaperone DnaK (HSP70)|nr:Hsp70 family protein [Bryobacteraceae bacterium]